MSTAGTKTSLRCWVLTGLTIATLATVAMSQPAESGELQEITGDARTTTAPGRIAAGRALTELGDMIADGAIAHDDARRLLAYYERSLEAADASALYAIVSPHALVQAGDRVSPDMAHAIKAYERGASLGDSGALWRLGDIYRDGMTVAAGLRRAVSYYRQAAEAGDATGRLRLGVMLALGRGVERDADAGRALVREVAMSGNAQAFVTLGDLLANGDVGPVDVDASISAYEAAALLGDSTGWLRLGDVYRDGVLVPADGEQALYYYHLAADPTTAMLRMQAL